MATDLESMPNTLTSLSPINPIPELNTDNSHNNDTSNISEKQMDNEASFFATFVDGSSFRNMIEYIRLPNVEGVFRFTKYNIFYEQGDQDNNILNIVELKTYELTDYQFTSKSDEIIVGINLSDLRNITRNVGKKDHIDLYKLPDEPKSLYIQIRSQSEKGTSNLYHLPITTIHYTVYKLPEYMRNKKQPTCTVYQSDFSKLCKSLVTIKCSHAMVHGFQNGVVYKGILNTGAIGSVKEFGKCHTDNVTNNLKSILPSRGNIIKSSRPPPKLNIGEVGEIERFRIDISIIKFLIKLNALSPTGTVKMYIEKGLPLKMVCNIGTFGKMSIYIMG
uniref:Proliferating cell nuclear antigen n=1 Tax=Pithovirus LCPAC302 TaxID=2506593 RepID=A0A481Z6T3_9VIRU|nr:MAG: proliferating cell nuclear antigen [Pithovirus LCPAC302]QBK91554.1 MAG: proliferating cell nuclear antigen [Pithovirus LCPAC302]